MDLVAPVVVQATARPERVRDTAFAVGNRRRRAQVRIGDGKDPPGTVVRDPVAQHRIVAAAGDHDPGSERRGRGQRGAVVVVVVDVVVLDQRAGVGAGGPRAPVRTGTVLRGGGVVVVLTV